MGEVVWWQQLLFIAGAALAGWFIYRQIKGNPQAFSKESLGKSFYTMGILALVLIVFIWVLVVLLRH